MKDNFSEGKKAVLADLTLVLVAMIWGGGFVVIKDSLSAMTPLFLMAIRFSLAGIFIGIVFFKQVRTINKADLKPGFIVGSFLFMAFAVQNIGLNLTTASSNAFLTATNVVFVPFLVWVVSKKLPEKKVFLGSALALLGVGLMTLNESLKIGKGDVLSFLCAIFFAFHIVAVGKYAKERDPIILTFVQIVVAALLMTISAFVFEPIPSAIHSKVWYGMIYQVIFSTVGCYMMQNIAQKYTTPTHTSIILSLEAFFATALAVLYLGEVMSLRMVFGGMCIFLSILVVELKPLKRPMNMD
jgi:drug/metabolite transporter (DMT)-like permease